MEIKETDDQILDKICRACNGALETFMVSMNRRLDELISGHAKDMANLKVEREQEKRELSTRLRDKETSLSIHTHQLKI